MFIDLPAFQGCLATKSFVATRFYCFHLLRYKSLSTILYKAITENSYDIVNYSIPSHKHISDY